jgi:hypothetical protein
VTGLVSWFDHGQNRESGGWGAERTDYEAGQDCADRNSATSGND